jgi:hypothetical protein
MSIYRTLRLKASIVLLSVVVGACFWGATIFFKRFGAGGAMNVQKFTVWVDRPAYSFDPFEHDFWTHHATQRPVLATIVSNYSRAGIVPYLASGWKVSANNLLWTFSISENLVFEDGAHINARAIQRSLTRIAFLQKKSGSHSGLLENVVAFNSLNSASDSIRGIRVDGDKLVLELERAVENFLEKISFGIYGVASERDFDSQSGEWHDVKRATASGPYRIVNWHNGGIEFSRRLEFPSSLIHEHAPMAVIAAWNPESRDGADVKFGWESERRESNGETFLGPTKSNDITFLHCLGWKKSTALCYNKALRKALRSEVYERLRKRGHSLPTTFFPPFLTSTSPTSSSANVIVLKALKGREVRYYKHAAHTPILADLPNVISEIVTEYKGSFRLVETTMKTVKQELNPDLNEYSLDLVKITTGVLVEDPWDDVRFMFQSTEGIRLPDPTGTAKRHLGSQKFSLDSVNEILWEDGIIWPIEHPTSGIWTKGNIDTSNISLTQTPTDWAFLGWK